MKPRIRNKILLRQKKNCIFRSGGNSSFSSQTLVRHFYRSSIGTNLVIVAQIKWDNLVKNVTNIVWLI